MMGLGTDPEPVTATTDKGVSPAWSASPSSFAPTQQQSWDWTTQGRSGASSWSARDISGLIGGSLFAIGEAVTSGFNIAAQRETQQLTNQAARQQLDQQMQLFQQQLASGGGNAQTQQLLAQAQAAQASGSMDQMLAVLAAMQSAQSSWLPWVIGGIAVLAVGGFVYWAATKKGT
jgi:hypothetical protein